MIERDYIMRMIQQLSAAIAKVVLRVEQQQFPEAFRELDDACKALIGAPWTFLGALSDAELIAVLGNSDRPEKLLVAAELLRQGSRLHALREEHDESFRQGAKAFSLYVELLLRHKEQAMHLGSADYLLLLHELERRELPESVELKRSRFYEMSGDLAKAMQVLSDLISRNRSMTGEGIALGRRLGMLPEDELADRGVTQETLRAWRRRWMDPEPGQNAI